MVIRRIFVYDGIVMAIDLSEFQREVAARAKDEPRSETLGRACDVMIFMAGHLTACGKDFGEVYERAILRWAHDEVSIEGAVDFVATVIARAQEEKFPLLEMLEKHFAKRAA